MPKSNSGSKIWLHLENLFLLILAGGFFWLGGGFTEYEISKLQNPDLLFIKTPLYFTLTASVIIILGSIIIFVMEVLIYYKRLENRHWLWGVIFIQSLMLILLAEILGYNRFIWILIPQTFSIFSH